MKTKALQFRKRQIKMDDGATIALWDTGGKGRAVVMVHGFPENHQSWFPLLEYFAFKGRTHYRFIVYDLRGHGESSKTGEASLNRFFADHLALIKALKLGRYHLVGHDWGGAIALHTARYLPQSLRSLAVMDTNYWKVDFLGIWHLYFLNLPLIPQLTFRLMPDAVFEFGMKQAYYDFHKLPEEVRRSYLAMFSDESTTRYWIRLYRNLARMFLAQKIPGLHRFSPPSSVILPRTGKRAWQVPTTMIWGRNDRFTPVWVGKDIFKRLRQKTRTEFHTIPKAGHFVHVERPEKVAEILRGSWKGGG